jgi:hypothetical protein
VIVTKTAGLRQSSRGCSYFSQHSSRFSSRMIPSEQPVREEPVHCPWTLQRTEWRELLTAAMDRIRHCVDQLSESQLWWRPFPGCPSIANQILHVCGNLKQWVVAGVSGQPGDRDRSAEFSADGGLNGQVLVERLETTIENVRRQLWRLNAEDLASLRLIQGFQVSVAGALTHSIPHRAGHAHPITLLTRMQLQDGYKFHWSPQADRGRVPI